MILFVMKNHKAIGAFPVCFISCILQPLTVFHICLSVLIKGSCENHSYTFQQESSEYFI